MSRGGAKTCQRGVKVMLTKSGKMNIHWTFGIGDTLSSSTPKGLVDSIDGLVTGGCG